MLTEAQIAAMEKAEVEKETRGEFDSECSGYCGAQRRVGSLVSSDRPELNACSPLHIRDEAGGVVSPARRSAMTRALSGVRTFCA